MTNTYRNLEVVRRPATPSCGLSPASLPVVGLLLGLGAVALFAWRPRRALPIKIAAVAGAVVIQRWLAGHDDVGTLSRWLSRDTPGDAVDAEMEQSFPASDAPSWSGEHAHVPH